MIRFSGGYYWILMIHFRKICRMNVVVPENYPYKILHIQESDPAGHTSTVLSLHMIRMILSNITKIPPNKKFNFFLIQTTTVFYKVYIRNQILRNADQDKFFTLTFKAFSDGKKQEQII